MRSYVYLLTAIVLIATITFVIELHSYNESSPLSERKEQILALYVNTSTRIREVYEVKAEDTVVHATSLTRQAPALQALAAPSTTPITTIYLAFDISADDFNYINYKALESLLITYPAAYVRVLIIGPQAADYYKIGHLLRFITIS